MISLYCKTVLARLWGQKMYNFNFNVNYILFNNIATNTTETVRIVKLVVACLWLYINGHEDTLQRIMKNLIYHYNIWEH